MSNARFSIVQSRAVRDTRITNSQFRTLSILGVYGDEDGWCFPKLATLAKDLGKSKQAISRDIQALVKLGYVQVTRQYKKDGSQKHNLYRLIFDKGGQRGVDGGSTSEVDGGSTSEVDALTTHINDTDDDDRQPHSPKLDKAFGEAIKAWESQSGLITKHIAESIEDMVSDWDQHRLGLPDSHPDKQRNGGFVVHQAIFEMGNHINTPKLSYLQEILKNWIQRGYMAPPPGRKSRTNGRKPNSQQSPNERWAGVEEAARRKREKGRQELKELIRKRDLQIAQEQTDD